MFYIDAPTSISIDSVFACKGLEIGVSSILTIEQDGYLNINSQQDNLEPSAVIKGSMMINGRCDINSSADIAFEVYGILINSNKVNTFDNQEESILVKPGGKFESIGTTIIRK